MTRGQEGRSSTWPESRRPAAVPLAPHKQVLGPGAGPTERSLPRPQPPTASASRHQAHPGLGNTGVTSRPFPSACPFPIATISEARCCARRSWAQSSASPGHIFYR